MQNHSDFVSDITYDNTFPSNERSSPKVWSSSYNGEVHCWDSETREIVKSFMLEKVRGLSQLILVNKSKLLCVSNQSIVIVDALSDCCSVLQKIVILDELKLPKLLEHVLKINESTVWIGTKNKGELHVWDSETTQSSPLQFNAKIQMCSMVMVHDHVWMGDKDGRVTVLSQDGTTLLELHAHTDSIKSMCVTDSDFVITGSASKEGKMCVWNSKGGWVYDEPDLDGYEVIDGHRKKKCTSRLASNNMYIPVF